MLLLPLPHLSFCLQTGSDQSVDCVDVVNLTGSDCDEKFARLPEGIDLALHRAKILSKYTKDISNYIEKRINLGNFI